VYESLKQDSTLNYEATLEAPKRIEIPDKNLCLHVLKLQISGEFMSRVGAILLE
jgi:hypothetical protein